MRGGQAISAEDRAIGLMLATARHGTGLSQAEVARRLGFAQSRLGKIETGARRLLFSEAQALADLYGVALADFVPSASMPDADQ